LFCGNARIAAIVEILSGFPQIAWKTLRVSHNPLEKLKNSFPTFPQNLKFSNDAYEEKIKKQFFPQRLENSVLRT